MWEFIGGWIHGENGVFAIMHQFLISLYGFLNEFLDNSDGSFLNILGMIGIALLTVMIPIAVTLITGFAGEKKSFGALDRNIIFKYIVNAERLLFGIALVYIPILLWDVIFSYPILRIIHLILWGCGVGIMVKVLINVSRWQKGHEFKLRYEYLKNLKNPREMRESWHSVWEVENIDGYSEKEFFAIFSSTIDKFLRDDVEKIKIAVGLVNDFNSFIDKRSSSVLVIFKENLLKISEWHFFIWKKTHQPRNEKNKNILGFYNTLLWSLSSTLRKIEEKELRGNAFYFFVAFKPHVEKYKKHFAEIGQDRKKYYIEEIMYYFFDALVKNIENYENGEKIWGDFPPEWKITMENIKKGESYVSNRLYIEFWDWARRRISSSTEYDKTLDDVAYNLFPHGSPIMWSKILTFMMREGCEGSDQIKLLIEHPSIFGNIVRATPAWVGDGKGAERKMMEGMEKQRQAKEEETISLALFLFGGNFTQNNLNNFIAEFKILKDIYDSERSMEYRRRRYIDIFEKLLEARRKKDAEK